jgi:hypothetical protein
MLRPTVSWAGLWWCQASSRAQDHNLLLSGNCGFVLTRGQVCRLQLLLVLASAVIFGSKSRGTHDHILLSLIRDSPNLEGQVFVFICPRNKVAQLYLKALDPLFIATYDSQGYGGGIRTRLHADRLRFDNFVLAV